MFCWNVYKNNVIKNALNIFNSKKDQLSMKGKEGFGVKNVKIKITFGEINSYHLKKRDRHV